MNLKQLMKKPKRLERLTEQEIERLVSEDRARFHEFGYHQHKFVIIHDSKDVYSRPNNADYYERIGRF